MATWKIWNMLAPCSILFKYAPNKNTNKPQQKKAPAKSALQPAKSASSKSKGPVIPMANKRVKAEMNDSTVRKWVEAIITCENPLRIPRLVPALTSVKNLKFIQEVNTSPGSYGAAYIYPGVWNTMKYWYQTQASGTVEDHVDWQWSSFNSVSNEIFLALPFKYDVNVDSKTTVKNATIGYTAAVGSYYMSTTGHIVSGKKCYIDGTFVFTTNVQFNFYNSDSAQADIFMTAYQVAGGVYTPIQTVNVIVGGHTTQPFDFNLLENSTVTNLALSVRYANYQQIGHVPSQSTVNPRIAFFNATFGGQGVWVERPLETQFPALNAQFIESSSISYTGQSCLLTNDSSQLLIAGHLVAAQLPSDAAPHFPQNPSELFNYLSEQTRKPFHSGKLAEGGYAAWTPDKLEDIFFRDTATEIAKAKQAGDFYDRPVLAFAWKCPDQIGEQTLSFTVRTRMEIISDDISMPYSLGPRDPHQLYAFYLSLISDELLISENPKHLQAIKDWVTKVVKSPEFKQVFSKTVKLAGGALLAAI
jgi:hypothetical protein